MEIEILKEYQNELKIAMKNGTYKALDNWITTAINKGKISDKNDWFVDLDLNKCYNIDYRVMDFGGGKVISPKHMSYQIADMTKTGHIIEIYWDEYERIRRDLIINDILE